MWTLAPKYFLLLTSIQDRLKQWGDYKGVFWGESANQILELKNGVGDVKMKKTTSIWIHKIYSQNGCNRDSWDIILKKYFWQAVFPPNLLVWHLDPFAQSRKIWVRIQWFHCCVFVPGLTNQWKLMIGNQKLINRYQLIILLVKSSYGSWARTL